MLPRENRVLVALARAVMFMALMGSALWRQNVFPRARDGGAQEIGGRESGSRASR